MSVVLKNNYIVSTMIKNKLFNIKIIFKILKKIFQIFKQTS